MSLIIINSESLLIKKLINYLDTYNSLYEITKKNFTYNKIENKVENINNSDSDEQEKNKKKMSEKLFNITTDYENLINMINNIILDDNKTKAFEYININ